MSGRPSNRKRVKFPLVIKLLVIILSIVLLSMSLITGISSFFFVENSIASAEENNLNVSKVLASQIEDKILAAQSASLLLYDLLRENQGSKAAENSTISSFFARNPDVAWIMVPGQKKTVNETFFTSNELDPAIVDAWLESKKDLVDRATGGETIVCNVSPLFGIPTAMLIFPYRDLGKKNAMLIAFSTEALQSMVQSTSTAVSFVIGYDGGLIIHPDFELVKIAANFGENELVKRVMASTTDNMQIKYRDAAKVEYIGSFRKLGVGSLTVTSSTPSALVYEAAMELLRRNLYLTGIVLLFSLLAIWFFSKTVSRPVLTLVDASIKIEDGQFELDIKPETSDELGLLTESFVHMGRGLAERERVKETFGKFVNKTIAEQALKGEFTLGGTRKVATIFFADIRSFTAISEQLSPEAVVEFLNDYMSRMVDCIDKTGGVVDKFIGDAIMGVWGAPISAGSPKGDALAAVHAMIMMRYALLDFNKGRGGPDKPLIHNGCGVNTGPCIAGQIGSMQRMEYTVIGDAVNLASRIEALNKPFGTDILISEYTYDLVKDEIIAEPMQPIKVKGKKEPLVIYAVIKFRGESGPETLADLRDFLGIRPPETAVDVDKEEVKYEIIQK